MAKGLYHKKLIRIFVSIAVAFIILLAVLLAVLSVSLINNRNSVLKTFVQSQFSLAKTSLSVINNNIMNLLGSGAATAWADETPGTPGYYYRALKLYQELLHLTNRLGDREYEIAITSLNPRSFVVTKNGTRERDWFFRNESPLSWEEASGVYDFFESHTGALMLPVYTEEGRLDTIVYALKVAYFGGDLVLFTYIPAQSLFQGQPSMPYFLIGPNQSIIYSERTFETTMLIDRIVEGMLRDYPSSPLEFDLGNYRTYLDWMEDLGITIGFVDDLRNRSADIRIIALSICLPLLAVVALLVAAIFTKRLYAPIDEAIDSSRKSLSETLARTDSPQSSEGTAGRERPVDEFALIKDMGSRINDLTRELLELTAKRQDDSGRQDYKLLLAGTVPEDGQDKDRYAVALFEIEESASVEYSYSLISLQALVGSIEDTECIALTPSLSAVIVKLPSIPDEAAPPQESLMNRIQYLLDSIRTFDDIKVAASDIVTGKHDIYRAYRQAQMILDYRRIYPKVEILTKEYVSAESGDSYYPSSLEQTFINYTLNGNSRVLALFDEIVKDNTASDWKANPAYQHFFLMLCGSFLRIFQELKQSPEQLIGRSVDWIDLFSQWNRPETLSHLRSILEAILRSVQKTFSAEDDKMLEKMTGYIRTNYMYDIMLEDLAKKFNITPKYCSVLFKKLSNDTFKNYLNQYRIEQACRLIKMNPRIKISDLSLDVGFNSATSFIRVFNKYTGISPKTYADRIVDEQA